MSSKFSLRIEFTERAKPYLAHVKTGEFGILGDLRIQPPALGDKIALEGIDRCPWFVVVERQWLFAHGSATLTIWLDEAD